MSVEEMIKALSSEPEFGDVWVEEETCKAIIAALHRLKRLEKAGQAMRDRMVKNVELIEDWDDATKEDDK